MKTVPAMTMRSASRGVPRITSAPKREMSYLLVMLVAISTKQQERPKLKGQTEFLRPQATRSSRRDKISVRGSIRPTDRPSHQTPSVLTHHPSASLSPIQCADAPKIGKGREQHNYKN